MNFPEKAMVLPFFPAALLRVSGPDAEVFLQGQFTNDLGKIGAAQAAYGLWLDRKGRVLADSHVVRGEDGVEFWIASGRSSGALIARRLGDFIVADDVVVEDVTGQWAGLALIGEGTGTWLAAMKRPGFFFRGRRAAVENWEWVYPEASSEAVVAATAGATGIGFEDAERLRIGAGIAAVPADIGPADLPNEAGLEVEAISYSKGCYLGQEVMARIKSLGRVRRALVRVRGDGSPPDAPAALWRGDRREGELRSVVRDASGTGYLGLALVSVAGLPGGGFLALAPGGPAGVEIVQPP